MGEVYRARDPRLRRDVALKVLRPALAADPAHMERLAREARAAGRLNHPNILAVFDVGTEGGVSYVVSELLQGESLRDRLARGPLPFRKALEYGAQVAQALGAAHEKGIWHRDVKPANIFITTDGRAKLLDFGLAQRMASPGPVDTEDSTASSSDAGPIRGTAGYMSPEQAAGLPLDHRSDIFALGAVLYELLTGRRAFQAGPHGSALQAVLETDPPDPREVNPALIEPAAALIRRCLEKNREERYQSARDLAFHLQQLYQVLEASRSSQFIRIGGGRGSLARAALVAAAAAVVGAALAAAAARALWRREPEAFEQLTFRRGRIGGARFASEGQAVLYSEARPMYTDAGQRNRLEVWRIDLAESPQSHAFVLDGADVVAASRGALALSLQRRYVGGHRFVGTLATVPVGGQGLPLEKASEVEDADWDAAGSEFAIARRLGAGGESALEYPIGRRLYDTSGSVKSPRISRDGRRIAFLDDPGGVGEGGGVAVVDLGGRVTRLGRVWPNARGLAWSPAGDEIWFAAGDEGANRALRAVSLAGRERVVLASPASVTLWDVAADGRVLLTRDEEWNSLVGLRPGWAAERDLSWFDAAGMADLSDDGQTLLFADRFGIYTRRTDGSPPMHLGLKEGFADDLSPDGRLALATSASTNQLIILPTGAGQRRLLPAHGFSNFKGALWCPDGRRVVFNGVRPGEEVRAYVQNVSPDAATPPRPLTPRATAVLAVSGDGEWAAATAPGKGISLWPIGGGPSNAVPDSRPEDRPVTFSADGRSLWVFRRGEVPAPVFRVDIATGRRELWRTLWPPDPAGVYSIVNFKVTPAGDTYFYSYAGVLSQLYVVRGLK